MFRAVILGCLILVGCVEKKERVDSGKIKVLSTIAMIGDIVAQIGGEDVEQQILIQGELDPHTYELVKGDDEKFSESMLIFYNGLGLEHGLSLRRLLENNPKACAVGDWILEKNPSLILRTEGQLDPHIWMDISLWAQIIDPVVANLSRCNPSHAEQYKQRGEELRTQLLTADHQAYTLLHSIPQEKRYLITGHNAFHYFTRRYLAEEKELVDESWRVRTCAPEGLSPDAEITLQDIYAICAYIKKYQVKTLFPETNLNKDALKKIASCSSEEGMSVHLSEGPLYGDAMGKDSYLKMMEHNVGMIECELTKDE